MQGHRHTEHRFDRARRRPIHERLCHGAVLQPDTCRSDDGPLPGPLRLRGESARGWRNPPSCFIGTYSIADSFSLSDSVSWLNWGLCLERGIVRISTSRATPWARKMPMKSSSVRVECPIVRISTEGCSRSCRKDLGYCLWNFGISFT